MMNNQEFFVQNVEAELPRFERVFLAVPAEKATWRPHEKSKSAIEIVQGMTYNATSCPVFLKTGVLDFEKVPPPQAKSIPEYWNLFKRSFDETISVVKGMTQQDWDSNSKMVAGSTIAWETTKCWMAWGMLLDLIHHRGQLSVYIRPMGGKVPSIYGPSGDTQ
jgi:uncharacterized damage-inducible protein DinB